MALTVEDGTGLAAADSYVSVAEYEAYWTALGGIPSGVGAYASAVLDMPVVPSDGDTVTIDGDTYTFKTTLTTAARDVLIGASLSTAQNNLVAAVNATPGGAGVTYGNTTVAHPTVQAGAFSGTSATFTARSQGSSGDAIAVSETFTSTANVWQSAALSGATSAMEVRLRKATNRLDHERWKGYRRTSTQALDWPRTGVYDDEGFLLDSDAVPSRVKQATHVLASKDPTLFLVDIDPGAGGAVESITQKLGPLSKSVKYDGSTPTGSQTAFVEVLALLRGLIVHQTGGIRFARMGV